MIITRELSISEFEFQECDNATQEELVEFFIEKAVAAGYPQESLAGVTPKLVDRNGEKLLIWGDCQ